MLILAFSLSAIPAHAQPGPPAANPNLWALTFEDNFDGTSLDPTKWHAPTLSRQANNSLWDPNQVSVGNGLLRLGITKVVDPNTGAIIRYDCGAVSTRVNFSNTYLFKQKYGYYEARYKVPANIDKDYWASFWIMAGQMGSGETDTRKAQEIDIMESFTLSRATHTANFHWGGYGLNHNKTSISLDSPTVGWAKNTMLNPPAQFHVYGFYWDKDVYVFYLDGTEIGRTNMVGIGENAKMPNPDPITYPTFPAQGTAQAEGNILLTCEASTWPGRNGGGWETDAPDQDEFLIDYVRVYGLKSAFEVWASGSASIFGGDANADGVPDGVAWVLGSASPGQNANGLLPTARRSNDGGCTVSFTCLDATRRGSSSLILQYSNDIGVADAWDNHSVIIPASSGADPSSGVVFEITPNNNLVQIHATIPASASGGTGRIFARLKAISAP